MIKFLKVFMLLFVLSSVVTPVWAQQKREIKGVVIDEEGQNIIGAVVSVKTSVEHRNKYTPAITDIDGNFTIELPAQYNTLIFSCLGLETKEIEIGNDVTFKKVVLSYQSKALDQVVITGYSQTTTKKITGSVGIITADILKDKPLSNLDAMIQGEIAGVAVQANTGRPGAQYNIRIRGVNNLSGNSSPLWVVDGVPLQNDIPDLTSEQIKTGGFDNIFVSGVGGVNPNDIENISILKDAAAAAIYGSRAANGVIVVTTKRGKEGKTKVSYSNNFTFSFSPTKNNDRMNSTEKLAWEQTIWDEFSAEKYSSSLSDNTVFYPVIGVVGQIRAGVGPFANLNGNIQAQNEYISQLSSNDTNWYDMLFRNSFSMSHLFAVSGG